MTRLGRYKRTSASMSVVSITQGDKASDDTIEEQDEDKMISSKDNKSSSSSFKQKMGGWDDWKELIDLVKPNHHSKDDSETVL